MSIRVEYPGFWTKKLIKSKQFMLLFKEAKAHRILLELGKLLVVDAYKKELQLLQKPNDHNSQYLFNPKDVKEALKDESWVVAMQEELNQFVANDVWELVPLPMSQSVIGTK
ncbi:hypothetical protein Tco_0902598 [Tanacetum coccineum]